MNVALQLWFGTERVIKAHKKWCFLYFDAERETRYRRVFENNSGMCDMKQMPNKTSAEKWKIQFSTSCHATARFFFMKIKGEKVSERKNKQYKKLIYFIQQCM